jgi:hypothetical protein
VAPLRAGSERPSLLESAAAKRVEFGYRAVPYRRPLAVLKVVVVAALALAATVLVLNLFGGEAEETGVMQGSVVAEPKERAAGTPALPAEPAAVTPQEVIAELKPVVLEERGRFAAATTAEVQAAAAARLESAYRDAGVRMADPALAASLTATAEAYSRLATAVSAGDQLGYDRQRTAVLDAEARTREALAALDAAP